MSSLRAYCLFCETQKCATAARAIESHYGLKCIHPRILQRKWVKGTATEEPHDWLPGYLFLYSEEEVIPFYDVNGIIRWLGNGELQGQDRSFADTLYRQGGVFGTVSLLQEGDRCRVDDPVWEQLSGTVTSIDRGRKRCRVEFEFDGIKRTVWVGYELIRQENEFSKQMAKTGGQDS